MACPGCGRAVRAGARFCGACGTSLAPRCPACGAENEPGLQFCESCGASFAADAARGPAPAPTHAPGRAEQAPARKVVSIVFADLVGSTALHERLDAEAVRQFMEAYYAAMRGAVEAHGGRVTQLMGDGVKAVFGAPRVAEDDAIRAVRAAVAMQQAFRALLDAQRGRIGATGLRIAVNTGEVVADDASEIIGDPVNVAARLQEQGKDGDVVIGGETQRIVAALVSLERLGSFALKGRTEAVEAYRVVSLEAPAAARAAAFVGRDEELRRLLAVYEAAVSTPATRLAVLLGSPGLGKSRLLDEVSGRLAGRATVLTARCEASGGTTFAPLVAALRTLLGIEGAEAGDLRGAIEGRVPGAEAERARIAAGIEALLVGTPLSPEETFYDVRRLLAALATERPVVLAIDDLHWAEPLLLDLIEHLVQWGAGAAVLVLAAARPELRDARSSLAAPGAVAADVVTLAGLDATSASRLAASVIGADALPAAVAGRVLITSEGNPLFLRELVRMLVNDGVLRREGERWTLAVAVADLDIPPTIQALLAARIERLRPEERLVLERAAVAGRHFSRAAVAQLLPQGGGDLDARLESLRRSELIEPDTGWFLGEPALRFHHVLIRDAAYRRVLKGTRAELHARLADWIEAKPGEHDEMLGWHLEQAHQNLSELGTDDPRAHALGERAARHLGTAGRRALARDDLPLAAGLLGRALDRLDADDPARADLALDWCEALLTAGDVGPAAPAVEELGRLAAGSERLTAWHTCFAGQLAVLTAPEALRSTASAVAAAAGVLAAAGDATGEAKAHAVHATALARLGENGACEAAIDRALAAARRVRDRRRQNAVLAAGPLAALWGPSPVTRASGRCLDFVRVLRITQGSPAVEAVALRCQAVLEALRGRSDAARRMIAAARRMVEELGITQQLLEVDVFAAHIDLLEGDAPAAERTLRGAYAALREHGLGIDAARAAALLGKALLAQGQTAEAEALSHESEALAGDDLKAAIAWRGVRAEALASRGEAAAAVELARAAVAIAAATDGVLDHADARLALAAALRAAGSPAEAAAEEARAAQLWEQKGATLLAERAREAAGRAAASKPRVESRPEPVNAVERRVRENAGTDFAARLNAAGKARDTGALPALFSDAIQVVARQIGAVLDREAILNWWRLFVADPDASLTLEPLATLGESLVLCRQSWAASATGEASFDVGAFARDVFDVYEVDAEQRAVRAEAFGEGRLGDAVAFLYQRYAELLPEGPERTRAAATARSVALMNSTDPLAAFAPGVELIDHRSLSMFGRARGVERMRRALSVFADSAPDRGYRLDDVLAATPDAFLTRITDTGTEGAGGGVYEIQFLSLSAHGPDGLAVRFELFDADRVAEALARFDSLTAEPAPLARRRVRENAASANLRAVAAAVAARDAAAFERLLADGSVSVNHTTGTELDRDRTLRIWSSFLTAEDFAFESESIATLGERLALARNAYTAGGVARGDVDVGAYERGTFVVAEVDAAGRRTRSEHFAEDRLVDALGRLYERHAELLPEGETRARAAAIAGGVAAWVAGTLDSQRWLDTEAWTNDVAPDVELVDRRVLGLGSVQGIDALRASIRALAELSDDSVFRIDDVLCAAGDVLVVRFGHTGTDRAGGGSFERQYLLLQRFAADGRLERIEFFDTDRSAEAVARFEQLSVARPRLRPRLRENAATAHLARLAAASAERNLDAISSLLADGIEVESRQTGGVLGKPELLAWWRLFLADPGAASRLDAVATLGNALALVRHAWTGSSTRSPPFDVGAFEAGWWLVYEVDAHGRAVRTESYALDRLGDAVARLYERQAELLPEGPARTRAAATAHSLATLLGPFDPERWIAAYAPGVAFTDHRPLGLESVVGAEDLLRQLRTLPELAGDLRFQVEDVLALGEGALVQRMSNSGTLRASGGAFERQWVQLFEFGPDGLAARAEMFAEAQADAALARFDALTAEPRPAVRRRVRPNLATENVARLRGALAAGDRAALAAVHSPALRATLHPTGAVLDLEQALAWWRLFLGDHAPEFRVEPIASLGDALALCVNPRTGSGSGLGSFDVADYESTELALLEVDAEARLVAVESFAEGRLRDAVTRLYQRHAELLPEGAERTRAVETARSVAVMESLTHASVDAVVAVLAPDAAFADHRSVVGLPPARGAAELRRRIASWFEPVAEAASTTQAIFDLRPNGMLVRAAERGRDKAGAAFERHYLIARVFDATGRESCTELFDPDRVEEALARFDEIAAEAPPAARRRVRPNAATANAARFAAAVRARDASAVAALYAESAETLHHPTGGTWGRDGTLAAVREALAGAREFAIRDEPLASLGDSLALVRESVAGGGFGDGRFDVGPTEREDLVLVEVDADGRRRRTEIFAPSHLGDALVRLHERYAEGLPDGPERARTAGTARSLAAMLGPIELDRYRTALAPDVSQADHRRAGLPEMRGAGEHLCALQVLVDTSERTAMRIDDVLALRPGADLLRWTNFGTDRGYGGAYERTYLRLALYGSDGRIVRNEFFETEHAAAALARFEELASRQSSAPVRRVRANAATENAARTDAAIAASDEDALAVGLAEDLEVVDHTTGAAYGREGTLSGLRALLRASEPAHRHTALAVLGDSLALVRQLISASTGGAGRTIDVGPYETEKIYLIEVDERGARRRHEAFATARLGEAIVRLYERYAERLPEGPERARAETLAGALANYSRHRLTERDLTPDLEFVDHRPLGIGSARGAERFLTALRTVRELEERHENDAREILALGPTSLLGHWPMRGTEKRGGGAFERDLLRLLVFAQDGRLARLEWFDPAQEAEALARFDALTSAAPPARRRPVRPNAATRNAERFDAAFAARDLGAIDRLLSPSAETLHHPTGATFGRDALLTSIGASVESYTGFVRREEAIATLGESLGLFRASFSALAFEDERFDVGAVERETFNLIETDAGGLRGRTEIFAPDRLHEASVRLYARHAERLPPGPERTRAETLAAALANQSRGLTERDLAPALEFVDHRPLGLGSAHGAEQFLAGYRVALALEQHHAPFVREILALGPTALLLHWPMRGTDRRGGGAFERDLLRLFVCAEDGRLARIEWFDPSQEAEALARFDAVSADATESPRIENAATRALESRLEAWNQRDWRRFASSFGGGFRMLDRRSGVRLELGQAGYLDFLRPTFEMHSSRASTELIATRGERLALVRALFEGAGRDIGPTEIETLQIVEVDENGEPAAYVVFDPDALDAAFEELDARYDAGEAAPYASRLARRIERTINARDWEALASLFAPDLVLEDHRSVGVFGFRSGDEYVAVSRGLVELAPDATLRAYHILALNEKGSLGIGGWEGHRDGGPFEIVAANVTTWDAEGRVLRIDVYGLDQLDQARARFAELTAAVPRIENAATRCAERGAAAWRARDWARFAALLAPGYRNIDRRGYAQLELDRDGWLASYRGQWEMTTTVTTPEILATRGERLALVRGRWTAAAGDVGPSEIESLNVLEVDEHGAQRLAVTFDPHDLDAAFEELDARFDAGEAAPFARQREARRRVGQAIAARDWEALAATFAPGFVSEDHRPVGVLSFRSGDEYVASVRAIVELAPDAVLRTYHVLALGERRGVSVSGWSGTRDGGAFETSAVLVQSLAADGRSERFDMYSLEQLDQARARYEALRPDLLRIPPNAAARHGERVDAAFEARDWDALRALYAPGFRYEDRRRGIRLSGGFELLLSTLRLGAESGGRGSRTLLATAGDRLSLERQLWARGDDFEVEALLVREVDAEGRAVAGVVFDPDDRAAASRELFERSVANGTVSGLSSVELRRALLDRDLERHRALVPPDFVLDDHRRASAGLLDADDFVAWTAALLQESPDAITEPLYFLAIEPHGYLAVAHTFGTNRSGGAFESVYFGLGTASRIELFDLEDEGRAHARFEELRPDPLRIPPNAAWRAHVRSIEGHQARDWAAIRDLVSEDFRFEDRGKKALVSGDVETWLTNASFIPPGTAESEIELLGTAGERVALGRMLWRGELGGGPVELERLRVTELDAEGRTRAVIWFDPEDRAAAFEEMHARFVAGEAGGDAAQAAIASIFRAFDRRDWAAWQRWLAPGFVLHDRRTLGLGELSADDWLASLRVFVELAPDVRVEALRILRWSPHGAVVMTRSSGTHEGGPFENPALVLALVRGPLAQRYELFDVGDAGRAIARFEELCAEHQTP